MSIEKGKIKPGSELEKLLLDAGYLGNTKVIIDRYISSLSPDVIGEITGINLSEEGLTVAWVEIPDGVPTCFEDNPVWNVQVGKYAFRDVDD